jgi:hypothetical protein
MIVFSIEIAYFARGSGGAASAPGGSARAEPLAKSTFGAGGEAPGKVC